MSDILSNDFILGIDTENASQIDTPVPDLSQTTNTVTASTTVRRKKSDRLPYELLTSNNGIPKLIRHVENIKFHKKKKNSKTTYRSSKSLADNHHFLNLAKILNVYQNWSKFDLNTYLSFEKFIKNLNYAVTRDPEMKHYVNDRIYEEKNRKIAKILDFENKTNEHSKNDYDSFIQSDSITSEQDQPKTLDGPAFTGINNSESEEEEEWPELFSGNKTQLFSAKPVDQQHNDVEFDRMLDDNIDQEMTLNNLLSDDEMGMESQFTQYIATDVNTSVTNLDTPVRETTIKTTTDEALHSDSKKEPSSQQQDEHEDEHEDEDVFSDDDIDAIMKL